MESTLFQPAWQAANTLEDWASCLDTVWKTPVPLALVPDIIAWVVTAGIAIWLLRLVICWRPRFCGAFAAGWSTWLGWQVCFGSGWQELEATQRRGMVAAEATDHFVQSLLALTRAWSDVFLPFWSDIAHWISQAWKSLTGRQRVALVGSGFGAYLVAELYRTLLRHRQLIKRVTFQLAFVVAGAVFWQLSTYVPAKCLKWVLSACITALPTVFSVTIYARASAQSEATPATTNWSGRGRAPSSGQLEENMQKQWLSYWACWPLLAALERIISVVPALALDSQNLPSVEGVLQRSLIVLVIWLQLWQGSQLFHMALQNFLQRTRIIERFAGFFGAGGLQALRFLSGGTAGGVTAAVASTRGVFGVIRAISGRLWLIGVGVVSAAIAIFVVAWAFYRAFSLVSWTATMLFWAFAAADTADTITHGYHEFYSKKLAFWILAMIWEALTALPVVGMFLRLFTPLALSLWLVAGEIVLSRVFQPIIRRPCELVASVPQQLRRKAIDWFRSASATGEESPLVADEPAGGEHDDDGPASPKTSKKKALAKKSPKVPKSSPSTKRKGPATSLSASLEGSPPRKASDEEHQEEVQEGELQLDGEAGASSSAGKKGVLHEEGEEESQEEPFPSIIEATAAAEAAEDTAAPGGERTVPVQGANAAGVDVAASPPGSARIEETGGTKGEEEQTSGCTGASATLPVQESPKPSSSGQSRPMLRNRKKNKR